MQSMYDVAIVGCGISSLACVARLASAKSSLRICILEASGRPGGRIAGVQNAVSLDRFDAASSKSKPFDIGAAWVHGTQGSPLVTNCDGQGIVEFTEDARAAEEATAAQAQRYASEEESRLVNTIITLLGRRPVPLRAVTSVNPWMQFRPASMQAVHGETFTPARLPARVLQMAEQTVQALYAATR